GSGEGPLLLRFPLLTLHSQLKKAAPEDRLVLVMETASLDGDEVHAGDVAVYVDRLRRIAVTLCRDGDRIVAAERHAWETVITERAGNSRKNGAVAVADG